MNLDSMTPEELNKFWAQVHFNPRKTALKLFPNKPRGYVRQTKNLGNYAINKCVAMQERIKGNIETASMYEDICDDIYKSLADYARTW